MGGPEPSRRLRDQLGMLDDDLGTDVRQPPTAGSSSLRGNLVTPSRFVLFPGSDATSTPGSGFFLVPFQQMGDGFRIATSATRSTVTQAADTGVDFTQGPSRKKPFALYPVLPPPPPTGIADACLSVQHQPIGSYPAQLIFHVDLDPTRPPPPGYDATITVDLGGRLYRWVGTPVKDGSTIDITIGAPTNGSFTLQDFGLQTSVYGKDREPLTTALAKALSAPSKGPRKDMFRYTKADGTIAGACP